MWTRCTAKGAKRPTARFSGAKTCGASQSNAPYNPAMVEAGAVGRFFNVGATYTF
jgi:hypothetical protein